MYFKNGFPGYRMESNNQGQGLREHAAGYAPESQGSKKVSAKTVNPGNREI